MPTKRGLKRKRRRHTLKPENRSPLNSLSIFRSLVKPPEEVFGLLDFIGRFAPSLDTASSVEKCNYVNVLLNIILIPLETIKDAPHCKTPECREPLSSLVDDVIFALVQRRERLKRVGKDGRNLLAQGYSPPTSDQQDTKSILRAKAGVAFALIQIQPNDNVTYCKTSRVCHQLHSLVGDDVFRMILLHTRLFLPFDTNIQEPRGNFIQVCGPPLSRVSLSNPPLPSLKTSYMSTTDNETDSLRTRKRRRRERPAEAKPSLRANSVVSKFALFYSDSYTRKIGLPKTHPLLDPTTSPELLLKSMTDMYNQNGKKRRKRWRRLRSTGIAICEGILCGVKKCDFHRLLEHYCPLHDIVRKRKYDSGVNEVSLSILAQAFTPPKKVFSFVAAVVTRVFPPEFWGSQQNLNCILGSINAFVMLRRNELLSNKRLMHGVRIADITWLHGSVPPKTKLSRTGHEAATRLTLIVLRWLFSGFVVPLIRSNFYVTETEFSAKRVQYYRKPVWSLFRALSMKKLMKDQFVEIDYHEANKSLSTQVMGFSHLRLVPKATGVRPIAHLSQRIQAKDLLRAVTVSKRQLLSEGDYPSNKRPRVEINISASQASNENRFGLPRDKASTNDVLVPVFDVLTRECSTELGSFGCGLRGLADFYPRYQEYLERLKQQKKGRGGLNLFFASVDIKKCYDNIHQERLYDIAEKYITHDDYLIQQVGLLCKRRNEDVCQRRIKKVVGLPTGHSVYHGPTTLADRCTNAVFDSRACYVASRIELCALLHEHLTSHKVFSSGRFGKRYFFQAVGISQGSILSMLLCNLYYGEMENLILHNDNPQSPIVKDRLSTNSARNFMARLVDDFLFVTSGRSEMENFLRHMYRGKEELGVTVNRDKSLASEEVNLLMSDFGTMDKVKVPAPMLRSARDYFPWCGLLFDTRTGEVRVDYVRFSNSNIRDSLTVDANGSEGKRLFVRMKNFVRPRCLPILFDSSINRKNTIVENFFQMMVLAAMKTVEYLRSQNSTFSETLNRKFLVSCIDSLSAYASNQIRSNLRCQSLKRRVLDLDEESMLWLSWEAFLAIFSKSKNFPSLEQRLKIEVKQRECVHSKALRKILRRDYDALTWIDTWSSVHCLENDEVA